jgi:predicted metal-dependent HD superfamily phosphohydrolase
MSVLAAPQHVYEVYSQQIKQEYLGEFASEG